MTTRKRRRDIVVEPEPETEPQEPVEVEHTGEETRCHEQEVPEPEDKRSDDEEDAEKGVEDAQQESDEVVDTQDPSGEINVDSEESIIKDQNEETQIDEDVVIPEDSGPSVNTEDVEETDSKKEEKKKIINVPNLKGSHVIYSNEQYRKYLVMMQGVLNTIHKGSVPTGRAATDRYVEDMTLFLKRQSGDVDLFGVDYMNATIDDRILFNIVIFRIDKRLKYCDRIYFPENTLPYLQFMAMVIAGGMKNGSLFHVSEYYSRQHLLSHRTDQIDHDRFAQIGGSGFVSWVATSN